MGVASAAEAKVDDTIEVAELGDIFETEVAEVFAEFHGEGGGHGG